MVGVLYVVSFFYFWVAVIKVTLNGISAFRDFLCNFWWYIDWLNMMGAVTGGKALVCVPENPFRSSFVFCIISHRKGCQSPFYPLVLSNLNHCIVVIGHLLHYADRWNVPIASARQRSLNTQGVSRLHKKPIGRQRILPRLPDVFRKSRHKRNWLILAVFRKRIVTGCQSPSTYDNGEHRSRLIFLEVVQKYVFE